jgi:hypothetical protein
MARPSQKTLVPYSLSWKMRLSRFFHHRFFQEWKLEWADVIRDLDNLIEMEVAIGGKGYVFRGQAPGVAGKVFQACGVALPPALRPCRT